MHIGYRIKQLILLFGDLIMLMAGFWLALSFRHGEAPNSQLFFTLFPLFLSVFFLWLITNYINGLYDLGSLGKGKKGVQRLIETSIFSFFIGISYFYLTADGRITPKTILLLTIIFGYLLSGLWRALFQRFLGGNTLTKKTLFVGHTAEVDELIHLLSQFEGKGYHPTALLDTSDTDFKTIYPEMESYRDISKIRSIINTHEISHVVISPHLQQNSAVQSELYELLFWPVSMTDLASFYQAITGRIPPSTFSEAWFLEHLKNQQLPVYNKLRLLIDGMASIVIGTAFLLLLLPVSMGIKMSSKGPIFFTQKRVGKNGRIFRLYKFRSMYALSADGSAELEGAQFATKTDTRITKFGKIMRKFRIDELPQVINLIKGDVTLIGPRPERPEIVQELTERMAYYPLRHLVRPGLTGWAVLHQNYTADLETSLQKLQYDLYYIKHRSPLLDLSITLKTINLILRARGQ